jgi:hypothetical protein
MLGSEFKTVFLSVRPARAAVFIDKRDTDSVRTCHRVIEWQSAVWGGSDFIVIPTDGTTISPAFWTLLEIYDPDYLLRYQPTLRDIKIADSQEYAKILDSEVANWLKRNPKADPDFSRTQIDNQLEDVLLTPFEISDDLQQDLKRRLAPFYYKEYIVEGGALTASSQAFWPFTPIEKIVPHCEHPEHVFSPRFPTLGLMSLWISSATGLVTPKAGTDLDAAGVRVRGVEFGDDLMTSALTDCTTGRLRVPGFDASPFELSAMNLRRYRREYHPTDDVVVVFGDTVDDFCLYYALSRVREDVVWFPTSWLDGFESGTKRWSETGSPLTPQEFWAPLLVTAILRLPQGRNVDAPIRVTSASVGAQELAGLGQRIDRATLITPSGNFSGRAVVVQNLDTLVGNPLRVYERDNVRLPSVLQFLNGELPGFIPTPKPRHFTRIAQEHCWISEVAVNQHHIPRHFALGTHVIRDSRLLTNGVRAGADGLAYFCPNFGTIGGADVDTYLVRPKCVLPDALEMFQHLASLNNMSCRPSAQGFYTQESAQKFEALATLAAELREPVARAILEKYTDTTSDGGPDDGVLIRPERRRYLDLPAVTKLTGSEASSIDQIDRWVQRAILYRGFLIKCMFCRTASWFGLDELQSTFACKRCARTQTYTAKHSLRPGQPAWFYRLDELVFLGLANHMIAPVLALDRLRRDSKNTFLWAPELEFTRNQEHDPFMESDICCTVDGQLCIGEAKVKDTIETTKGKEAATICGYRDLATVLGARTVIFATTQPAWSERTKAIIGAVFNGSGVGVRIFEEADLLT